MKNALLSTYTEMILSLHTGSIKGKVAVSKPLFIIAILFAIETKNLVENKILFLDNDIRNYFGLLYGVTYDNDKGYELAFFIRPYYHLSSAPFYHLIWKSEDRPPIKGHTPSGKYLRENLLYAKLDDDLWELLQDKESREYIRTKIFERYLKKDNNKTTV